MVYYRLCTISIGELILFRKTVPILVDASLDRLRVRTQPPEQKLLIVVVKFDDDEVVLDQRICLPGQIRKMIAVGLDNILGTENLRLLQPQVDYQFIDIFRFQVQHDAADGERQYQPRERQAFQNGYVDVFV